MDWIYRSTSKGCFVWALIDSPEEYRVEALRQFKECLRQEYDEAISMIAALQKGNDTSTSEILFQCVAVSEYVRTLPSSAQRCSSCGQATPEGADIIRRRCQKTYLLYDLLRRIFFQEPEVNLFLVPLL
ncbi:hypothetical protein FOPG_17773 [Fusarium oxysporum f. sp. conglutinans race 2 54008]|uniref:Uncharacterized protein n=1 Tax=Fusarium oxysporum f. sp. conglutinans race 2 54008 TaxID=1089457 RepID=X0HY37_FUSOX|nr:hypothetical protein FOPG_17773 [Fusarium oxysporum f. sp. conglutinans race 2 54008]